MGTIPHPTERYTPCADLWCITAYFNPAHYKTRRANYETFAAPIRAAGIPLLTVECAFGDDPFDLPSGPNVLQVRGPHVLWQKERLINLGVAHLPQQATKVTWLDGDILFTNPKWAVETAALLDEFAVVQPFKRAIRLKRGASFATGDEYTVESFALVTGRDPQTLHAGTFHAHGHTGFAWAARRDFLAQHELYESFINGTGDHYIAHAMKGDWAGPCMANLQRVPRTAGLSRQATQRGLLTRLRAAIPRRWKQSFYKLPGVMRTTGPFWAHFFSWAQPMAAATSGRIGWAPGEVLHLWHGDGGASRGHGEGWMEMHRRRFDPANDVRRGQSGCLEWASHKPGLRRWAEQFFAARREDGV
jgi:hypothetical protein